MRAAAWSWIFRRRAASSAEITSFTSKASQGRGGRDGHRLIGAGSGQGFANRVDALLQSAALQHHHRHQYGQPRSQARGPALAITRRRPVDRTGAMLAAAVSSRSRFSKCEQPMTGAQVPRERGVANRSASGLWAAGGGAATPRTVCTVGDHDRRTGGGVKTSRRNRPAAISRTPAATATARSRARNDYESIRCIFDLAIAIAAGSPCLAGWPAGFLRAHPSTCVLCSRR